MSFLPDWKGAKESNIFAENFWLDYFEDSVRKDARELFDRVGKIVKIGEMRPDNGLRGSFILEGERGELEVRFTLTPETPAKIQEYHIRLIK